MSFKNDVKNSEYKKVFTIKLYTCQIDLQHSVYKKKLPIDNNLLT